MNYRYTLEKYADLTKHKKLITLDPTNAGHSI